MTIEVNRQPKGLQELLLLNLQGEAPRTIEERVLLTLDLADFYYEGRGQQRVQATVTLLTAPGPGATITVPPGEVWAVRSLCAELVNTDVAAAPMGVSVGILFPGATFQQTADSKYCSPSLAVGATVRASAQYIKPWILTNCSFVASVDNSPSAMAVGVTTNLAVIYYKLAYQ